MPSLENVEFSSNVVVKKSSIITDYVINRESVRLLFTPPVNELILSAAAFAAGNGCRVGINRTEPEEQTDDVIVSLRSRGVS